jgi:sortase (surface protein transpeptidase)
VVHPRDPDEVEPSRGHQGVEDLITGPVLPHADPLSVAIPRLHIASGLVQLGIDDQGAMEVPVDPADAGWYRLGPPPGSLGPAVIAGHVTWNQVPAVFFRLSEVRPGDVVEVTRADGRLAVFEVTAVRLFDKSEFPTQAVFGPVDHAALRLITCGGDYESSAHRYLGNVVVFARLASSRGT